MTEGQLIYGLRLKRTPKAKDYNLVARKAATARAEFSAQTRKRACAFCLHPPAIEFHVDQVSCQRTEDPHIRFGRAARRQLHGCRQTGTYPIGFAFTTELRIVGEQSRF
jgi:hypothetical protein